MEDLALVLQRRTTVKTKMTNERQEIIKMFADRLNADRGKLKPLNPAFISMKMNDAGVKDKSDLYQFYGQCKEAKNFSKYWWWSLKAKI